MKTPRPTALLALVAVVVGIVVWGVQVEPSPPTAREEAVLGILPAPDVEPPTSVLEPAALRVAVAPTESPSPETESVVASLATPATSVIVGVLGADGAPVGGITASVAQLGERARHWRGSTDARGEWEVVVSGGGPAIVALDCGLSRDVALRESEPNRIGFVLPSTSDVTGRVLDTRGAPIAGAVLMLARPATTEQKILPEPVATTDATGHYHVRHLVPQARLGARARGFAASPLFAVGTKRDWPRPFDIVLVAGGARIEGRVLDAGGDPVADATIQVATKVRPRWMPAAGGAPHAMLGSQVRCQPASDGAFAIDGLEPGQVRLLAWSPRHARQVVDLMLVVGETVVVSPQLRSGATLVGRILDADGHPIVDAQVSCGRGVSDDAVLPTTRTDSKGAFHLPGLPAGEILVRARSMGKLDGSEKPRLVDGQTTTLEFSLSAAPHLAGCVLDADGAPARNVVVGARDPATRRPVSGLHRIDGVGRFVLPCTTEGPVALWVRRDGMDVETVAMNTHCPTADLVVRLADCAGSPASVRGVLRGADGPIEDQYLFLLTSDGRRRPADVTSPGSGVFATDVPPGSYEIRTRLGDAEVKLASFVVAGGQQLDLGTLEMPVKNAKPPR